MVWEVTSFLIVALYSFTIFTTIFMMLLENRNPVKTIAWIVVLLLFPVAGLIIYIFFGKSFRKKLLIFRRSLDKWNAKVTLVENDPLLVKSFPVQFRNMAYLALNNSNASLYVNNQVHIFTNGTDLFDDMFAQIEQAHTYIHIEYYIFLHDDIGTRFSDLLIRKAHEGVKVRLIIDDVGSWLLKKKYVKLLREAGIEVHCFLKVFLPMLNTKVNYRNHRKIVIIDGKVGYTGGMNVADRYVTGSKYGPWRDTHIRIDGEGVHGLQCVFISDWYFLTASLLNNDELYYPSSLSTQGNSLMQIVPCGPDSPWLSIMQMFCMLISQARHYVYIETPYFLPSVEIVNSLQLCALSGVDVRILLPRHSDASLTLFGSFSFLEDMMRAGIKVYFYEPGFLHSKTIVADDLVSSIGSANMDFRSFEQNFEVNSFIYDADFAKQMCSIFREDLSNSTLVDAEEWHNRPKFFKVRESLARLFSPIM